MHRHARLGWLLLAAYALLLLLPNFIWLGVAFDRDSLLYSLLIPTALLISFFSLFGKRLWLACTILAPFALLVPIETFYILKYLHPSTATDLAIALASNPREAHEYFGADLFVILVACVSASIFALIAITGLKRLHTAWRSQLRLQVALVAFAIPILTIVATYATARGYPSARYGLRLGVSIKETVGPGYPAGVIERVAEYGIQAVEIRHAAARLEAFRFGATRAARKTPRRQIYVLVIGESSRRDHWQLFGYSRETNPELSKVTNLVRITDMITPWPESMDAISQLMTRRPVGENSLGSGQLWQEASIVRAMQESGYATYWLSNQLPLGLQDSPIAAYAREARTQKYVNHTSWSEQGSYDEDLLKPLDEAIATTGDVFIVLHMMGSHMQYDYRYPESFARFRPTTADSTNGSTSISQMVNSYDNTILYTDHVLARVIERLQASDAITALWYESDHGETLPTALCRKTGHANATRWEYEIPAFVWYSEAYADEYPELIANLKANADKRVSSADTFESLIDMAGVSFPGHEESHSLMSAKWTYRLRLIQAWLWSTDFDRAIFSSKCDTVLPP